MLSFKHGQEYLFLVLLKASSASFQDIDVFLTYLDEWKEEDLKEIEPHSYDVQIFYLNIKQTLVEVCTIENH